MSDDLPEKRASRKDHPRRCTARSKRTGEQCGNYALKGQTTCKYHGGNTKRSLFAAQMRLLEAADPGMAALIKIALDTKRDDDRKLRAMDSVLDRIPGLSKRDRIDLVRLGLEERPLSKFEETLQKAVRIQRLRPEDGDDELENSSRADGNDVIDAEVVEELEDRQPPGYTSGNVIDLPSRTPARREYRQQAEFGQQDAMLSQTDLQDGERGPRPSPKAKRRTQSRMTP
jgi:hypothetical protein